MTVFAVMDEWISAAGRTDPWLELGLDLMDGWQLPGAAADQAHLAAVLAALREVWPTPAAAPDPRRLAVWFHHAEDPSLSTRLSTLAGAEVCAEVARLVLVMHEPSPARADVDGSALWAAHRQAVFSVRPVAARRLAAVPDETPDQ